MLLIPPWWIQMTAAIVRQRPSAPDDICWRPFVGILTKEGIDWLGPSPGAGRQWCIGWRWGADRCEQQACRGLKPPVTAHSHWESSAVCVCVCDPNPLNKTTEDFRTTRLKNYLSVSALKWLFSIIKPVEILQFDVFSCCCSDSWRLCASRFLVSFSWKISRSFCFCAGFIFPFALPKSRQKSFKIAGASQIKVKTHSSHPNAKQLGRE